MKRGVVLNSSRKYLFLKRFSKYTIIRKDNNKYVQNLQRAPNPSRLEGQLMQIVWLLRYLLYFKYRKGKHKLSIKLGINTETSGVGGKAKILGLNICGETLLFTISRPDYKYNELYKYTMHQ